MDRLTDAGYIPERVVRNMNMVQLAKVYERLCEYENTGLTPEQIREIDKAFSEQAKELMGYKNAESQGTLIRVPVAKGSRVYEIIDDGVDKAYIQGIKVQEVSDSRIWANDACFDYDDIGRTIFISPREAAESICKNKWTYLTNQEVINVMAKYTDEHVSRVVSSAHAIAIAALGKQVPKKPMKIDRQAIRYTDTYRCPFCGGNFVGTGFANYCYHCGQALDWEEDQHDR